ncbi:MAG: EthD domain-containing protein [Gammaproteobacteria bacterium]
MIKVVFCLRRLPQLSRAQFQDYWRSVHAPLVRERAAILGIRRYVQCHTVDHASTAMMQASRGCGDDYDGIAELWFDSAETMFARVDDARVRQAGYELLEDERRFIDLPRSPLFLVREHEFVAPERSWS